MRIVEQLKHYNRKSLFTIQITSMVDMMTILLVFLLTQQTASSTQTSLVDGLSLPKSRTSEQPVEALKLIVTKSGIFVNDKKVVELQEGKLSAQALDNKDQHFIVPLFTELDGQAEKSDKISAINETVIFDGKAVLQADSKLNYALLKKVMYTAAAAGYSNIKMATINYGD